ncbi:MAG: ABC transporter ATP-binding protein, partial [Bacteroidota bacterium]|nr:ABC transporter ATP-binding protein [Bacteroidota bacterium]
RVALAKTIVSKANFLLLDEPTNHLDMHSCDLLIEALSKYEGSYLLVSHDRYFISKTANKIWEIDDHQIREFKGDYEEWVGWKERNLAAKQHSAVQAEAAVAKAAEAKVAGNGKTVTKAAGNGKTVTKVAGNGKDAGAAKAAPNAPNAPIDKEAKKELQKQQRLFQQLEEKIASLTKRKNELEASLSDPSTYSDKNKFVQTEADYQKAASELERSNQQYEQVFEKIMELEKNTPS